MRSRAFLSLVVGLVITGCGGSSPNSGPAPAITTQPASHVSATVGSSVTFDVAASGSLLVYTWHHIDAENTDTVISGSRSSSLTINRVQYSDRGNYYVVVTNGKGSVTSSQAFLAVFAPTD